MVSQFSRTVFQNMSKHISPLVAQMFVEKYLKDKEMSLEDFEHTDLPHFIMFLATNRHHFSYMEEQKFQVLLNDLVRLSNSNSGIPDRMGVAMKKAVG